MGNVRIGITSEVASHRGKSVLKLKFHYNAEIIEKLREIGALWSKTMQCWYVENTKDNIFRLEGIIPLIRIEQKDSDIEERETKNLLQISRVAREELELVFSYDRYLIELIKELPFHSFDKNKKIWRVPHREKTLELLNEFCKANGWNIKYTDKWVDRKAAARNLDGNYHETICPPEFQEKLKLCRYSEHTQKNYCSMLKEFIHYFSDRDIKEIQPAEIQKFLLYLIEDRKVSRSYHNIALSAIKFYYEKILNIELPELSRPRTEKLLPVVLSEEEIDLLLKSVENIKHKCLLMTIYSGGLRLSEVVGLKIKDIDSKRKLIFIRGGKGNKDRYTLLSDSLLTWLRKYFLIERPVEWLFEGHFGGQYSMQSVQHIMREAVRKSGIRKHATVHTLRHSFATHLLENGVDLRYIQSLMGHNSIKTTEIYTHITTKGIKNIVSPLDKIMNRA